VLDIKKEEPKRAVSLTEKQKEKLLISEQFLAFFDRSSRVLERALDEEPVRAYFSKFNRKLFLEKHFC
jgi:hypothetical protein